MTIPSKPAVCLALVVLLVPGAALAQHSCQQQTNACPEGQVQDPETRTCTLLPTS